MNMSSNARKGSPPRSSSKGVTTLGSAKARVFVFLTLMILTAVFSASALTANQTAAPETATAQQSGYFASSFNNILSFFGLAEAAPAQDGKARGCDTAPEGLLACYRADNDTMDSRGVHNGEWVGTYGYATGKVGAGAFNFGGKGQVVVADAADLNPGAITVDGWVNLSSTDGDFVVVSKGDAYSLRVRNGNVIFASRNANGDFVALEARGKLPVNEWAHLAATHDGDTVRLYIDGEEVNTTKSAGLFSGVGSNLTIGSMTEGDSVATFSADEVKLFSRALTAKEISEIAGNRPDAPDAAITVAPVAVQTNEAAAAVIPIVFTRGAGGAAGVMTLDFGGTGALVNGVGCNPGNDAVSQSAVAWGAGDTQLVVNVQICNDTTPEPTETLTIEITAVPAGDTFPAGVVSTITIIDDDAVVTMSAAANSPTEGNDLVYTFNRNTAPAFALPINFSTAGTANTSGAIDDADFETTGTCLNEAGVIVTDFTATGTLEIPAGASNCTFRISTVNDARVEPDESLNVTITAGGYTIGAPATQNGTIVNNDFAVVDFGAPDPGEDQEGNPIAPPGQFVFDFDRVVPAGSQTEALTVNFTLNTGSTALCGPGATQDYTVVIPGTNNATFNTATCTGTITFAAGNDDAMLTVNAVNDNRIEPDETIVGTMVAGTNTNNGNTYTIGADTDDTATIDDDDETITVASANTPLSEAGPGSIEFTVTRNFDSTGAGADQDPAVTDALTVDFTLSALAPTSTQASCTGSDYVVSSGSAGNTVTYNPVNCTGTVTFLAVPIVGDTTAVINVTPVNDTTPENDETLTLTIVPPVAPNASVYGVGAPGANGVPSGTATANGVITNDDLQVIVRVAPAQVLEGNDPPAGDNGGTLVYTFTRIGQTNAVTCANFNVSGDADAASDFTTAFNVAGGGGCVSQFPVLVGPPPTGRVAINGGAGAPATEGGVQANQTTFTVTVTDDAAVELDELVIVQVDNHTGVGPLYSPGNPAQATGTILNDDSVVSIAVAPSAVLEDGAGNLVYTFSRTGGCGAALTVNYTTSGTATAGTDYTGTAAGAQTVTFAAGQCTTTVTVDPTVDPDPEADETVILTLNTGNDYTVALAPNNAATGTIQNDDTGITVAASASVPEGTDPPAGDDGGSITYTFTRTGVVLGALTVNYTLSGSATLTNGDFTNPPTLGPNTVAFAPGATTATVVITPVDDRDVEANEDVTVTVTNGTGYAVGVPASATSQILNDDTDITCALAPTTVTENGAANLVYTCTRTGVTASALTIPFTFVAPNTATFGTDYVLTGADAGATAAGGNLTFGAGNTTAALTVDPTADLEVEADETVTINFASGNTFDIIPNPTTLTGTITNDDTDVSVTVAPPAVAEDGAANLVYTFTRNTSPALLALPLTVNFSTTGTATTGTDYTQTSTGSVTFAAGSATATVTVDPTPDAVVEPDETVILTVTAGTGYTAVAPTAATGTITNDDTSYTIVFSGVTGAPVAGEEGDPGDPGETIATFTITRNGQNSPAGSVSVSTIPGSGTATAGAPNTVCQPGQDYTSDGQTLNFAAAAPGETSISQTFTVRICRDLAFELTETFDAQLSNPTGGFPGVFLGTPGPVATATIIDDDNPPVLTVANVTVNENAGTATLTVTQSVATGVNTSFSYTTGAAGDTATAGADYTTTTGNGTIAAGATTATVTVPIIDDNIDEPNETFAFRLTAATNATISPAPPATTATVTIVDNEPNTTFAINNVVQIEGNPSVNDPSVASTSAFNFNITRTGDAQANEVVCFETVDGDIENPAINPNPATGGPNNGGPAWQFDYTPRVAGPSNCVTFTQGGPSVITVPVIVYGDPIFEFDEYFTVRILTVNGVANPLDQNNNPRITDRLGLGTIQNDDLVALYTIAQTSPANPVTEGNSGQFNVTYTVTRTQTAVAGTVDYATSTGTGTSAATAGTTCGFPVDFLTRSGTLTFAAGVATQTFTVPVCGDTVDELNESFAVTLSNPTFGALGSPASVTTTITDDDAAPIISVSDVSACEVNSPDTQAFVFTITRAGASALTSTVTVNTVSGTAVSPGDFVAITGQVVTFAPGETTKTVTVTVNGDNTFETDESFTLQVVAASSDVVTDPAGGADPIGLGVIQNVCAGGDPAPAFALGPVTQLEGTTTPTTPGTFFVRLTRTGTTEVPATLTYSTAGITGQATGGASCTAGVDYITVSNATVNFPAGGFTPLTTGGVFGGAQGANFVDVPVQVCQDATFENNETFNVTLAAVQFANISPTGSPALVTITNDDGLAFSIRAPGPEGAEGNVGNTNFTFTIDRIGDSSVASTVCYETVNGTATAGSDYVALVAGAANCVNFTAGTMSANVVVQVIGDTIGEADETFSLRLISATAGTFNTDNRVATINNDDGPILPGGGVEGDVVDGSGGAAGDGLVQANDVTAIRNAILGTLTLVTTPNQFQRADVNLPCGNGGIDAGDVTVIRNMILGTVPNNTPACGPTAPGGGGTVEASRPDLTRIVRAVNVNTTPGSTITVAFQLDSQGDETSLSFTANWNPAVLTYVSSAVGNGVPAGTNFNVNSTQTAQGRLGVLLDSTNTYAQGTRQIATVTFTVAANAAVGTYPITFSSTPTVQSTSNAQGALLPTAYEQGNVVIVVTAAGVRVSGRVTTAGGQGLRNATVVLTDSEGNRRTATTGSFGIYTFEDVEAGGTYVVGVQAKRYRFASRIVNVTDSLTDVNFVGQE